MLSMLTGFLELGSVIFAIRHHLPLVAILGIALAYQVGALLKNPIYLSAFIYRLIAISAIFTGFLIWINPWFLDLDIFLISVCLQGIREEALQYQPVGTLAKRISRIIGFILVGLLSPQSLILLPVLILLLSFGTMKLNKMDLHMHVTPLKSLGISGKAMIIHQSHYFIYTYSMPILFILYFRLDNIEVGLAFIIGWISYSLAPVLLNRFKPFKTLIAGHISVSVILLAIFFTNHDLPILLTAWFLSGFGGGTVFCIKRLAKTWSTWDHTSDMDAWENIGHVIGVLSAIMLVVATNNLLSLFPAASFLAMCTVCVVTIANTKHRRFTEKSDRRRKI